VAGVDLTIHQSPTLLLSNRAGGTTGAVVWKITPLFAAWLASPDNVFFATSALSSASAVLELGCGISGITGLVVGPKVSRFVLTDQSYVSRILDENLEENSHLLLRPAAAAAPRSRRSRSLKSQGASAEPSTPERAVCFIPLDWETDQVTRLLTGSAPCKAFDAVIACDCIYNEALIEPLVQTCVDACKLRSASASDHDGAVAERPSLCIVAQQLRDPDVFETWFRSFSHHFRAWRIPDHLLTEGLRSNSGFVIHVGILRESVTDA